MSLDERVLNELGERIARARHPNAGPALRAQLRVSLMSAPVTFRARRGAPWSRIVGGSAWSVLRPVLAAGLALGLAFGGAGVAAASSLPGDPVFTLKRAAETVELVLATDDETRLRLLVVQSERRLVELEASAATRPAAAAAASKEYAEAVARVDAALTRVLERPPSAERDETVRDVEKASDTHLDVLEELQQKLPEAAQPGIQRAIEAQHGVNGKSGDAPGRQKAPRPAPTPRGNPSPRR